MTKLNNNRSGEKGNALFLILIAVVLFAALSYAITQSNRGSGAPNRETALISSTTVTQYTSALRTGITRMLLRNITPTSILFIPPTEATYGGADAANEVFHPDGGGVSFIPVDTNTVETVTTGTAIANPFRQGNWYIVNNKVVEDVGTTTGDVVAMLTDVREAICQRINEQITGTTTIPVIAEALAALQGAAGSISDAGTAVDAQAFLCVETSDGTYVYYHVLAEQ